MAAIPSAPGWGSIGYSSEKHTVAPSETLADLTEFSRGREDL